MRSESESDSLIAFPRSCIRLLSRSSTFCPFRWAVAQPGDSAYCDATTGPSVPWPLSINKYSLDCTVEGASLQEFVGVIPFDRMKSCHKRIWRGRQESSLNTLFPPR